jgi:aryl-alcohol dehydrogenase-like predicted oxidoreductase
MGSEQGKPEEAHSMRMRTLGGTGIKVSPYSLGAMMFGAWGNPDHEDSIRIIHAALDGGVNFVDTADVYSAGESEEIVGQALRGRRDDVVLATKANRRGYVRFRCERPPYSILVRGIEASVLPTCQQYGMGVIAWSPLAGGWLTGRYRKDADIDMTTGRAPR